jgi:hypothetical protein
MKKLSIAILLVVHVLVGYSNPDVTTSIVYKSGPKIRIPGMSTPTVIELTGTTLPVRWKVPGGYEGGPTLYITAPGTYSAEVNYSTNPDNPFWTPVGASYSISALSNDFKTVGPNPLNETAPTSLCLFSNAAELISSASWKKNGIALSNTQLCLDVVTPGTYTVHYTYTFEGESVVFTFSTTILPSVNAPDVVVKTIYGIPIDSYNPVTPPFITVKNPTKFTAITVLKNDQILLIQGGIPTSPIPINDAGTYNIGGKIETSSTGILAFTNDIVLPKGHIPVPTITASNNGILTYENPHVQLTTQTGYNSGYTWYLNGEVISNATINTLDVTVPGDYSVKGCALYPDGTSECTTSVITQVTGEIMYVNFVRKKIPLVENVTSSSQLEALDLTQLNVTTTYLDGLARPIQTVQQSYSPSGHDVVVPVQYDSMSREPKKLLPFTRTTNDGTYRYMPLSLFPLKTFYQQENDQIANTAFPFAETIFEASPLNRPLLQGQPGEDWQISTGHVSSFSYLSNTSTDKIWLWTAGESTVTANAYYPAGALMVSRVTDADGNVMNEFKDKSGHVIVSERIIEAGKKLRTYFIYDDLGRLTNVLPPKTTEALPNSPPATVSSDILSRECFSYQYDSRGRVNIKNIPGAGLTYIVYDPWDRVVLTQQANQRTAGKWLFNKYDQHNRLILTGETSLTGDYTAAVTAVTNFYASVATNPALRFESAGGTMHGFTNRSFPVLANQNQIFTVSYYDNYDFLAAFGAAYQFTPEPSLGLTDIFPRAQKLLTGTKTIILGTNNYLKTVHYYNKRHQLIQLVADNHVGGIDKVSNTFDFSGKMVKGKTRHQGAQSVTIDKEIVYDHAERIAKIYHTVNNGAKILLAQHEYNELGQLIEKNIHSEDQTTFLQSLDYAYNIRGWLSQFNSNETESNVKFGDVYGFELSYTKPPQSGIANFKPSYTGNISAYTETRPTNVDDAGIAFKSTFAYEYDKRNQLTKAIYYQPLNNGAFDIPIINYDSNGNFLRLQRKQNGVMIDDLLYLYNGNQLLYVNDSADANKGFIDR